MFPSPGKPSAPLRLLLQGLELASRAGKLTSSSSSSPQAWFLSAILLAQGAGKGMRGWLNLGRLMVSAGGSFQATVASVGHGAENTRKEHRVLPPRRGLALASVERAVHEWQHRRGSPAYPPSPQLTFPSLAWSEDVQAGCWYITQ